jgi:GH18 family chitinase
MNPRLLFLFLVTTLATPATRAQQHPLAVIGYYAGRSTAIDSFPTRELTHIIFSFCHLKGNQLHVSNARDTAAIQKLVALRQTHPDLKVILSLGGWGGCKTCPDVFRHRKRARRIRPLRKGTTHGLLPHRRHRPRLGISRPGQCPRVPLLPRRQGPFHRPHPPAPD